MPAGRTIPRRSGIRARVAGTSGVAITVAVAAIPALAAAPTRTSALSFSGRTSQKLVVRLGPVRSGRRAFRYQARLSCSDDSSFTDDPFTDYVLVRRGRFSATVSTSQGAVRTRMTGAVSGRRASGTIRIVERYSQIPDAHGDTPLDPNGGTVCDSRTVRWSARAPG